MTDKRFQPDRMPGYTLPVYEYRMPPEIARGERTAYPVIVVGGGLGGLTAALELGSRGVRTVLLDDDNTAGAACWASTGVTDVERPATIKAAPRSIDCVSLRDMGGK